jgi:3-hydroxyisobutyrate dehydrogenase-like beta-hydroxyacid dehydrogenase
MEMPAARSWWISVVADVALLGVGRMGAAMARKLVEAGHHVVVWNRSPASAEALAVGCAVTVSDTAHAAVTAADVVITMLADGPATVAVLLDPAVIGALRPGTVVCDMATSGVDFAVDVDRALSANGIRFVDAPVSGSVPTIAAGQLLVMASGDREGVAIVEPILMSFAKRVVYVGDAGAGQAMKLAVNLVVHTLNAAVSEALTLATSAGVAPEAAYDIFQDSVIAAPFVNYKRAAFLDAATPVAMSLALTRKDLALITDFAGQQGVPASVVGAVLGEVTEACSAGFADQDMAALARYLHSAWEG